MKHASIVGRPQLSVETVREMCKAVLGRDLSTSIKGQLEPLAVMSKLINGDEYTNSTLAQKHLCYTLALVCDSWCLLHLQSILSRCQFLNQESLKEDIYLSFVTGSVFDYVDALKDSATISCQQDILEILNKIHVCFTNEGYTSLFKDVMSDKHPNYPNLFYLRKKS